MVARRERGIPINRHGHAKLRAGTIVELEPGIRLPVTGQDEHHGPVRTAEGPVEGFLIGRARLGTISGVGMDPYPTNAFRLSARVNLLIEEVGHGFVLEGDRQRGAVLPDEPDVLDQKQVVLGTDAKPTDFGVTQIAEKQELAPSVRREAERRDEEVTPPLIPLLRPPP